MVCRFRGKPEDSLWVHSGVGFIARRGGCAAEAQELGTRGARWAALRWVEFEPAPASGGFIWYYTVLTHCDLSQPDPSSPSQE